MLTQQRLADGDRVEFADIGRHRRAVGEIERVGLVGVAIKETTDAAPDGILGAEGQARLVGEILRFDLGRTAVEGRADTIGFEIRILDLIGEDEIIAEIVGEIADDRMGFLVPESSVICTKIPEISILGIFHVPVG